MRIGCCSALILCSSLLFCHRLQGQQHPLAALTFEASGTTLQATGWGGGPPGTVSIDSAVFRSGGRAGRIIRDASSPREFSSLAFVLPRDFTGDSIQLKGWLRTEEVEGVAAIWLREDGDSGPVQFATTQQLGLAGTNDWQEYRIALPVDPSSTKVYLGVVLAGTGTVWVDDLELSVDGGALSEATRLERTGPAADAGEFSSGSGISPVPLSRAGTENLVLLGKVWGFAKYHHPRVIRGAIDWDAELLRVMPSILQAEDRAGASATLADWLERVGPAEPCDPCAKRGGDLHLSPDFQWIRDASTLGARLSGKLVDLYENRPAVPSHRYVSHTPQVGNPSFAGESDYSGLTSVDAGYRMLALFRFWNIIEYWFPYRDLLDEDWDAVLAEFVPQLMAAAESDDYRLSLMRLIARVDDTHANLWSELALRPPRGGAQLPVTFRFVEGRAVVTGYSHATLGPASGLSPGDVIQSLAGEPVDSLIRAWSPFYAASNEPTRLRDIAASLGRGPPGPVRVTGRRGDHPLDVTADRVPVAQLDLSRGRTHDLPGETFQRLDDEVAYLKLSSVRARDAENYILRAEGAKVLVIDIRNYPGEFVVFALGSHLVDRATPFARFTRGDPSNPGAFAFSEPISLPPLAPRFDGSVVVLVDEVSQSQAEYTTMAFRAAPNTIVVGSTTAGADGNVSRIPLPGGIQTMISGIGVFYPDRAPTQRVGIVPDLEVRPTIEGIRAGRDEVLEAGVSRALGREWRLRR